MSANVQNKILNRMFSKVAGVVWDLSSNSIGLQNTNGIYTLTQSTTTTGEGAAAQTETIFGVSVNPFDSFGFAIPAFAQITKLEDVAIGDIVIGEGDKALGWVVKKHPRSLVLLDQSGMTKQHTPVKVAVLGQDGARVVKPLTGLFGSQGASGFGNALLPLMLMGDGLNGMDDLLPIMLMTQQTAGDNANAMSAALPTILMMKSMKGGNGGLKDMLLPLILTGGLTGGNGGGVNPMMLMALAGDGGLGGLGGGNAGGAFVAEGHPALQQRPAAQNGVLPALRQTR
ncbi:hypothetical protein D3C87_278670 [compost metagenome]